MPCSQCDHTPTATELLRGFNPFRFPCARCGATLVLGWSGWLSLGLLCVVGVLVARIAANQYTSGAWSLALSLVFLGVFFVAVFGAELVYVRLANLPAKQSSRGRRPTSRSAGSGGRR